MAAHMTSQPLKDFVVDIPSQNTSVSGLTSSVNSNNSNDTRYAISAAKIMVEALEMLQSPELQKKAFSIAMDNSLFRNLVENYNNPPHDTQPVMPAGTLGARRMDRYRKKQYAVDTITSSINSLSTQEEKNAVIKKVVENTDACIAVLALGYV